MNKLEWILTSLAFLFLVSYILFSSWSTSLDFKIEKSSQKQIASREEYEQMLSALAQTQSREALWAVGTEINLVEAALADGYIDLRPPVTGAVNTLANKSSTFSR
ncbi:MAG: hypothetical protein HYT38_02350 [Candidatus Sungbacteria bacterium]|nr:hypothetical protein [Candidatus Sungbacteria bacterium]